ncbi:MAG TPA: sulfate permease [Mycobacteriales bacterium]
MSRVRSGRGGALVTLLPGVGRLRGYERSWLRGDLLAGITVAAYLIPQVMAYAVIAGLPAVVGLWAMFTSVLVYAVLGSSRLLSVGPESTTALLTAAVVAPLAGGDPGRYAALAAALALTVGGLVLLAGLARLGFVADLLSKPVLVGYLAGVGVLMMVSQLGKLTGVRVEGETVVAQLGSFASNLDQLHVPTLLLGLGTVTFLLAAAQRFPHAPVPLAGIVLATLAVALLDLTDRGIRVVGPVSAGLPSVGLPDVSAADLLALLLPAAGVAIVGYTDNVLTARAFGGRSRSTVDANQELLALGTANLAAGVIHTFPVSSSGSRTAIAAALGGRTQLYSIVALATVVGTLLFGRPLLAAFPVAALGAIVVYAATRLVDLGEFGRFARFRRSELVLALAATAGVLAVDILYGVLIAVALSILDLLRRVARPHDGILGYAPGVAGMHDIDDYPGARTVPGLVVYRYDAPLCFANAEDFVARALGSVQAAGGDTDWFLLNAEANVEVDITSVDALEDLRAELVRRGVVFAMARVKQDLRLDLMAAGLVDRIGADRIFPTLPTAVDAYVAWYSERYGGPPVGLRPPGPPVPDRPATRREDPPETGPEDPPETGPEDPPETGPEDPPATRPDDPPPGGPQGARA